MLSPSSRQIVRHPLVVLCLALFLVGGALVLFRTHLLVLGAKHYLNKAPHTLTYQAVEAQDGVITVSGLQFVEHGTQFVLDQVRVYFHAKELVSSPLLLFESLTAKAPQNMSEWVAYLVRWKRLGMDVEIESGSVTLGQTHCYFGYERGQDANKIGSLFLFVDPEWKGRPFLQAQCELKNHAAVFECKIEKGSCTLIASMANLAFPHLALPSFDTAGEIDLVAQGMFDSKGTLCQYDLRSIVNHVSITDPTSHLTARLAHLDFDVSYPAKDTDGSIPTWQQLLCFVFFKEGEILLDGQPYLRHVEGSCSLDPRKQPAVRFSGEVIQKEQVALFSIEGKGSMPEANTYLLDLVASLEDLHGISCETSLTCTVAQQGSVVIEIGGQRLKAGQIELAKRCLSPVLPSWHEWHMTQGVCSFQGALCFEQGSLSQFQLKHLWGEQVTLAHAPSHALLRFSHLEGEGRWIHMRTHPVGDLRLDIQLPFAEVVKAVPAALAQAYHLYRPTDQIHLSSSWKWNGQGVEAQGVLRWPSIEQSLQFGFVSSHLFPTSLAQIQEGWARSSALDPRFYGPSISLFADDLEVSGKVDLIATYQERVFEGALQIDDLSIKHPQWEIQIPKMGDKGQTAGRAKFVYSPEDDRWEGSIPLQAARCVAKQIGRVFEECDAQLQLLVTPQYQLFKGTVDNCSVAKGAKTELANVHFAFSCDEHALSVEHFAATPLFLNDPALTLQIPCFSLSHQGGACELSLWREKQQLAHCFLGKKNAWNGELVLYDPLPFVGTLSVDVAYDPFASSLCVQAKGEKVKWHAQEGPFSLRLDQRGEALFLDHLLFSKTLFSGKLLPAKEGYSFSDFSIRHPQGQAHLSGTALLDISEEGDFTLRATLLGDLTVAEPLPLHLKMASPCKAAVSGANGWIVSDLVLEGDVGQIKIDQMEQLLTSQQGSIHRCRFIATPPLIDRLIHAHILPELAQDLRCLQGGTGEIHLAFDPQEVRFVGALGEPEHALQVAGTVPRSTEASRIPITLEDVTKNEKLEMVFWKEGKTLRLQSIQGELAGMKANIHHHSTDQLVGTLSCDLSHMGSLLSLPIVDCFKRWEMGKGYTLKGAFTPAGRLAEWSFQGKLEGKEVEFGGHTLDRLDAKVHITPRQIIFENIDVTDKVAKVWIGEGSIVASKDPTQPWTFHFPSMEIRNFLPRLLHRAKDPSSASLVIQSANIEHIWGTTHDLMSVTGKGNLRFDTKGKVTPFQELPGSMLKTLGVESSLFFPEHGEIDFRIQKGRCYLQNLKNVYSPKRKLEFLMPTSMSSSYLDFAGNLFFDIEVKKRGSSEGAIPFSIRGTWDVPKVHVQ